MAVKKTKAEQIASIPIEDIVRMGGDERKTLEKYVSTLKNSYKRRVQSFQKKGLVSYAQIALEGTMPDKKSIQLTKMTRNQLILEFARYAKFFNDVTSSEKGIKRVNLEQDLRIFGKNAKGRPNRTMTSTEREKFWRVYDEFLNQNPNANSRYGSESIQQHLADAIFDNTSVSGDNLLSILNEVETTLANMKLQENLRSVPNVYSGRGTSF